MFPLPSRPEDQLLLYIVHQRFDDSRVQRIKEVLSGSTINWQYVFTTATEHGVGGLLSHHLLAIDDLVVPTEVMRELRLENQRNTERSLALTGELTKIIRALSANDIPSISFKGPILALIAYGDIALRQFSDLDIFVKTADINRTQDILTGAGFTPYNTLTPAQEAALLRFDNAYAFKNATEVIVDVHWRFAPRYFSLALETDDLWRRAQPCEVGGQILMTLSSEDLLVILCCHGFTHEWERLIWICDVASLMAQPELDWDYILQRAKRLGVLRIILVGLLLARELGARLPAGINQRLDENREIQSLAERMASQIFRRQPNESGLLESLSVQLSMRERLRDKLALLWRFTFIPRHYDWTFAALPLALSPLYYAIRPIRLAKNYGRRLLNTGRGKS